jgi:hypothetical protein
VADKGHRGSALTPQHIPVRGSIGIFPHPLNRIPTDFNVSAGISPLDYFFSADACHRRTFPYNRTEKSVLDDTQRTQR